MEILLIYLVVLAVLIIYIILKQKKENFLYLKKVWVPPPKDFIDDEHSDYFEGTRIGRSMKYDRRTSDYRFDKVRN